MGNSWGNMDTTWEQDGKNMGKHGEKHGNIVET
jgi:hypothetical protein